MLSRQIRIKWWKKFNIDVVCIRKIQEWLNHDPSSKQEISSLNKESLFLSNKQKIMAALASASSKEEFEKTLEKATSLHGSAKDNSEEGSSQSNPYLQNEDMYYD